jgi:CRP/FNR family cyclic AMP-dependent transcriptional regulator
MAEEELSAMADGTLMIYLAQHSVFKELKPEHIALIASFATAAHYAPQQPVFEQGKKAEHFYIVREGRVTVQIPSIDGEPFDIQTLADGSILGWSWLLPPYRWNFDARATTASTIIAVDGEKLRAACDADNALGYQLLKRVAALMAERLNAARMAAIRHYSGSWV